MATNVRHYGRDGYIALAVAVASGAESGDVVLVGAEGLTGLALTDRATTATIDAGTAAPGLTNGQATVAMTFGVVIEAANVGGVSAIGEKAYMNGSGNYSSTASGNTFIGWFLSTGSTGVDVLIGLDNPGS